MSEEELVCAASFVNEFDANLASVALRSADIDHYLAKDDCGGLRPYLHMVTGIRLMVRKSDAEDTLSILRDIEERNADGATDAEDAAE
jgi:hypothetical protein